MLTNEELQIYIDENWREEVQAHGFSPYVRNANHWYKIVNDEVLLSLIFFSPDARNMDLRFGMTLLCDRPSPIPFQRKSLHYLENQDGTTLFTLRRELYAYNKSHNLGLPLDRFIYTDDMFSEFFYPITKWYYRTAFDVLIWPTFDQIDNAQSCYDRYCELATLCRPSSDVETTRSFAECAYLGMFDACKRMVDAPEGMRAFLERYWQDKNWRFLDGAKSPEDKTAKRHYAELKAKVESVASLQAFESYRRYLRDITEKEDSRIRKLLLEKAV